jgi:hypothetical protein
LVMPRWWPSIIKCVNGCFDSTEGQCLRLTVFHHCQYVCSQEFALPSPGRNGLTWTATIELHPKFVPTMMKACMSVANLKVAKVWGNEKQVQIRIVIKIMPDHSTHTQVGEMHFLTSNKESTLTSLHIIYSFYLVRKISWCQQVSPMHRITLC